jgi:hypothetical protein
VGDCVRPPQYFFSHHSGKTFIETFDDIFEWFAFVLILCFQPQIVVPLHTNIVPTVPVTLEVRLHISSIETKPDEKSDGKPDEKKDEKQEEKKEEVKQTETKTEEKKEVDSSSATTNPNIPAPPPPPPVNTTGGKWTPGSPLPTYFNFHVEMFYVKSKKSLKMREDIFKSEPFHLQLLRGTIVVRRLLLFHVH